MPELPEVETIKRGLEKVVTGKKIVKFEARDPKVVKFLPDAIEGEEILGLERRAKILVFRLSGGKMILCHLKMTGQLIWEENYGEKNFVLKRSRVAGGHPSSDWVNKLPNAYTRAIFHFDDGSVLFFNDLRRFGWLKLYKTEDLKEIGELRKLGSEPFSDNFTAEYMMLRAKRIPTRKIKQFIIDQEIISGVGNIYVDEALFYSGILPTRAVRDILISEWQFIRDNIRKALELGIKYGGSSEDTYVDAFGNQGTMGEHTKVYRKTGKPCQICGTRIERIELGGRGTHFCPVCQK